MNLTKILATATLTGLIFTAPLAHSRDTKHLLPIEEAMQSADFKERLDPAVKLYFGSQGHGPVADRLSGGVVTNRKTNAFGKSDEEACRWVFLSALISLQERAVREGGNAVINISSYYKKNEFASNTQYECHAGSIMAGTALKGDVVRLK